MITHWQPHLVDGYCQCDCDDCHLRLTRGCICQLCDCDDPVDDRHFTEDE